MERFSSTMISFLSNCCGRFRFYAYPPSNNVRQFVCHTLPYAFPDLKTMNKICTRNIITQSIKLHRNIFKFNPELSLNHSDIQRCQSTANRSMSSAVPGTLKEGLNVAKDGWFTELSTMWPGQGMSFKVNEVVHTARSDFQVCCMCAWRHPCSF